MAKDGEIKSFPLPSSIKEIKGAEDWRSMYPYFSNFQPEDDNRFWFYNGMHFPEVMPPFDVVSAEVPYSAIGANTARMFSFPTTMGIEFRIVNGRVYITANPVTDPAQIEKRLGDFLQRAGHYYENWDSIYTGWQKRINALIKEIEAVEIPTLPDLEPIATIMETKGIASNHYVKANFHKCIELYGIMWQYHTEMLMLGYGAYVVFFEFCKKAFPDISDQIVARMVAGIEVTMYRPDDELKRLAKIAVDEGLDDLFVEGCKAATVLAEMAKRGDAGKKWLAEFEISKDPWFNVSNGDGFYHHHRSWEDDLTLPFSAMPRYVSMIKKGENLNRPTEKLKVERERITEEYRALLTTDEDRGAFDQMLGLCRTVFPFVEDHKFYCEHWFSTRFFQKIRGFGTLLKDRGVLEHEDDIFQLQHTEATQALTDVMLAWSSGGTEIGARHWRPIIAKRKEMQKALATWSPPPALGPIPKGLNDPAFRMLWGVTEETIMTWAMASSDAKEVKGYAASPGVVEGTARVLKNVNEIGDLKDGEILVCPITAPSWGPVFGKIKAAVSDIGGTMSHAAIVAREYGMPAVVGTGTATKIIKTGDKIRVDGDRGIVTILG